MNFTSLPILAQAAEGVTYTRFEFARIQSPSDYILPVAIFVAIGVFVWAMYRRDAVELHPLLAWILVALRTAAFLGLLIFYLQPQWRTEHEVVRNSRAVLLVDTSLSMGLSDANPSEGPRDAPPNGRGAKGAKSRIEQVAATLAESDLLRQLRKTHDVFVLRFNESLDRDRVALDKLAPQSEPAEDSQPPEKATDAAASADDLQPSPEDPVDWIKFLKPRGAETQLGTALSQSINEESDSPLSAIIVFTDGGQNAGKPPEEAIDLARKAKVPIFTVGVGSSRKPTNVRVSDLVAPARAYPGDDYLVTGYIQAQGLAGQVVEVQLLSRETPKGGGTSEPGSGQIETTQQVTLGADGEVIPVKFELTPEETGRRTLCFRVQAPQDDRNPADNYREVEIEILDRKNRVLVVAGGPTREYRFLRSLLYRDRSTTLDILLQTAQPGVSQEADTLLDDFPTTREEMFAYDCVVAIDPDWQALSVAQTELLETWVAERSGGLIVVAGPVFAGRTIGGWVEDPQMAAIRKLYPVEFQRRFSVLQDIAYATAEPWQLNFTREGLEAEFLWLDETATAGQQVWAGFAGVYGCCLARGPKPGATVLARFSDPRAGQAGSLPVFFAEHFYGSGRVFYIGSGEMWRLRRLDPSYFERFYTKLIRHVSQGALLRGSTRGALLVGQDRYLIGTTVEVRAQLTNAQQEPLEALSVPLQVVHLDSGAVQTVTLEPDPARLGTYAGRFPVLEEGSYRIDLVVPESEDEHLTRRIQVSVPDLERENPQRNDALLSRIAKGTGGKYYDRLGKVAGTAAAEPLAGQLKDRTMSVMVPAPPGKLSLRWLMETVAPRRLLEQDWVHRLTERPWAQKLLDQTALWVPLLVLCGLLCLEWLIRRLAKLA